MTCGLLLQMLHITWSVCLSVCWAHGWVQKRLNRSGYHLGADSHGSKEPRVSWESRSPLQRPLLRGKCVGAAHSIVPMHECIAFSAGKRACTAHTADECVRRHEGWRPFALLPNYLGHQKTTPLLTALHSQTLRLFLLFLSHLVAFFLIFVFFGIAQ